MVFYEPKNPSALMGQKKKKYENDRMFVSKRMVRSRAFIALNGTAKTVLFLFLTKRIMKPIKKNGRTTSWIILNNGEIEFTYIEAEEKYGISKKQFAHALDVLVEKGFIDITHQGGAYRRDKSLYSISERWRKYGKPDFEEACRDKDPVARGYRKPNHRPEKPQRPKGEPIKHSRTSHAGTHTS